MNARAFAPAKSDTRWKWLLLVLWCAGVVVVGAYVADQVGVGGRAWYGWWDSNVAMTARPYVVGLVGTVPNGATARGGLRDGDTIDLRELTLAQRLRKLAQPLASRPTEVVAHRGGQRIVAQVTGSTMFEGDVPLKVLAKLLPAFVGVGFLVCVGLIAAHRRQAPEARLLAVVLLWPVFFELWPGYMAVPSVALTAALYLIASAFVIVPMLLLVKLAAEFGTRARWRSILEWVSRAIIALAAVRLVLGLLGTLTLWFDPLPYLAPQVLVAGAYATIWTACAVAAPVSVLTVAAAAVATSTLAERARTAWLILPLSFTMAVVGIDAALLAISSSWFVYLGLVVAQNVVWLVAAFITTYALLRRRVLDFEFVLTRSLVVAVVSLIVVVSFVLLEWILGSVLAGVSHLSGLIANAALALVIGVSLGYIQKGVDGAVERVLFRKRRDDERALRDFAKEAAFVTDIEVLLDQALACLQRYTDAGGAAVLLDGDGAYRAVRSFGSRVPVQVDENDPAILALKAHHQPLDPHRYATGLDAALVLPMLARGRLNGIVVLGERVGGEAYVGDEVEALAELAQGVGSALDILAARRVSTASNGVLSAELSALRDAVARIPDAIVARLAGER